MTLATHRMLLEKRSDFTKATQIESGCVWAKLLSNPTPSLISTKNKRWMDVNAFLRLQ